MVTDTMAGSEQGSTISKFEEDGRYSLKLSRKLNFLITALKEITLTLGDGGSTSKNQERGGATLVQSPEGHLLFEENFRKYRSS